MEIKETEKCNEINCPESEKEKKTIHITEKAVNQIRTLLEKYEKLEWMAALIGTETEEKTTIEEIKIYEQEVSKCSVVLTREGNKQMNKEKNTIGWIHSHNEMGVFTSTTDLETAEWNKLTIVVNNKLEILAKKIIKLPCGRKTIIECKVEKITEKDKEIEKQADELIKERIYTYNYENTNSIYYKKGEDVESSCGICGMKMNWKKAVYDWGYGTKVHKKCFVREHGYEPSELGDEEEIDELTYMREY